jgi:hypothetical protein
MIEFNPHNYQKIKTVLHGVQALLIFVSWCITIAVLRSVTIDGRVGWYFGLVSYSHFPLSHRSFPFPLIMSFESTLTPVTVLPQHLPDHLPDHDAEIRSYAPLRKCIRCRHYRLPLYHPLALSVCLCR